MAMNFGNPASQNMGLIAWDGTAATPIDIRKHNNFGITFNVAVTLAADTIFEVQAAPASDADVCVPGTFVPVEEVITCIAPWGATPDTKTQIVLPSGTPAGSKCVATLPCKPDAFIKLVAGTGPVASVRAVVTLSGPR